MTREQMWFGTEDYATWITPPKSGADSSPQLWSAEGTLLNGDGYVFSSVNSHKVYQYAWSASSSRQEAQRMKNFADGVYGTGKLFFIEPTIYDQNVLPAKWAAPTMTANYEGEALVPNVVSTVSTPSTAMVHNLPVSNMVYTFDNFQQGALADTGVFVPIPEGFAAVVTVFGASGDALEAPGVYCAPQFQGGGLGTPVRVMETPVSSGEHSQSLDTSLDTVVEGFGMRLWIGAPVFEQSVTGTLSIRGIQVRLFPLEQLPLEEQLPYQGWTGGMGHSGCRLVGKPTFITHNKINGGQIEYAATFKESLF